MHVVQVIGSLAREAAGLSYSVPRLAEALAERGVRSEVLSVGEPGQQALGSACSRVLSIDATGLPGMASLRPSRALAAAIDEAARGGAVLHNHGLWRLVNVYPARAARRHGAPLVVSPRGMLSETALSFSRWPKRAFWHALQRHALEAVTCFHATSSDEARDIRKAGLSQPVALVPNGIDAPDVGEVIGGKRARSPDGSRTLLQLGRLHPIKRIDRLLEAWARLEAAHSEWRLRIVGPSEGMHKHELMSLAARLGLARVTFEPEVFGSDKDKAFREADLMVLASDSENFGMVVAEALANGTPVIATRGAPWAGLTAHGCGWWIDRGVEPLANALNAAMALDRSSLDSMGVRGLQWMIAEYSWGRVASDMEAVYRWTRGEATRPACVEVA